MTVQTPISNRQPPETHVRALASRFHEDWKRDYRAKNGATPRMKRTSDRAWIALHGDTAEVDIASADFESLPSDWQRENREAAQVALALVESASLRRIAIDEVFIETAAADVHRKWLERTGNDAPEPQRVPYAQLPHEEKNKDRHQVRAAVALYQQGLRNDE